MLAKSHFAFLQCESEWGFFFLSTQKPDTPREGLTLLTVPLITKAKINLVNITEI